MDPYRLFSPPQREAALLVGVVRRGHSSAAVEDSLDELSQLAETAGADVKARLTCRQDVPHPATFIGRGKAAELAARLPAEQITTVVFDDDLSPAQARNLENLLQARIIDRTQMILDIFAHHARTREGALQIELAQLQYRLPRLRRLWTHLERQKGGIGLMTGAGEQQLEVDRRRIEERITRIRGELEMVRRRRAEQRRGRRRHGWALITLVGYTNAGKSTLLNSLTGAAVHADDQLFATLDPTTRKIRLPNNQPALVTDTVGFIRKLPHHLVESFRATLEEVVEADLLIHVVDTAHPRADEQIAAVENVLRDLGADKKPILAALNKMDQPEARGQEGRLTASFERAVAISALTGEGLDRLADELADALRHRNVEVRLRLPVADGQLLALLRQVGNVHSERFEDADAIVEASVPAKYISRFEAYAIEEEARSSPGPSG